MNLSKGLSTPIAILLIVVVAAITGVVVWQFTTPEEQPEPTSTQPSDYTTQATCESEGYYWYEDSCHKEEQSAEGPSEGKSITVTFPNGGEEWKVGESKTIKWESQNVNSNDKLDILLSSQVSCGPRVPAATHIIKSDAVNDGKFEWEVGEVTSLETKVSPGNYVVTVRKNEEICDGSDASFSINWNTYKSEELGFEFEYPPSINLQEGESETVDFVWGDIKEGRTNIVSLSVSRGSKLNCDDEQTWVPQDNEGKKVEKKITVDGFDARFISQYESTMQPSTVKKSYVCTETSPPIVITLSVAAQRVEEYSGLLDKILSNFQVID